MDQVVVEGVCEFLKELFWSKQRKKEDVVNFNNNLNRSD
jgi:hypothetical protein